MQGFKIRHNVGYPYKRDIKIPEDFAGHRILLRFDGVYSYARVWVNGRFVRDHHGGFTTWDCDITDFAAPGQSAWLTVEVTDGMDEISYGSGYAHHLIGGILRDVSLLAIPQDHFSHLHIETDLDADFRNARLKISAGVLFHESEKAGISFYLCDGTEARPAQPVAPGTDQRQSGRQNWTSRSRSLFSGTRSTRTSTPRGETQGRREDGPARESREIGFREVELVANRLLVNGRPVKLRGACRHDVHPLIGRRSTRDLDRRDALLAKEANINFIRTSHYPPSAVLS